MKKLTKNGTFSQHGYSTYVLTGRAWEIAWWLKYLLLFAEDPGLIPVPTQQLTTFWVQFSSLFMYLVCIHTCTWYAYSMHLVYIHTCRQTEVLAGARRASVLEQRGDQGWIRREQVETQLKAGLACVLIRGVLPFRLGEGSGTKGGSCNRSPVQGLWDYSPQSVWGIQKVRVWVSGFSLIGEERASLATGGNRGCYTAKL